MPRKRKNERSDGRIQVQLDIGRDENGKRIRKYFYGKTRREAEEQKSEFTKRLAGELTNITLSEWIDSYLSAYRTKVNTLYLSQDDVPYNRLKRELGTFKITAIKELDLQKELNALAGKSFSSCSKYLQVMKRVFKKARKNGLIAEDPAEDLSMPSYTKGTHRALTKDEIELVIRCCALPESYMRLWILLMLFCGLRRGEMMALDWSSVNMDAHTLTVKQTAVISGNKAVIEQRAKTEAGLRIVPIPDILYNALLSAYKPDSGGFVCLSAHNKPLTESAVTRGLERFNAICTRARNNEPINAQGKRTDLYPEPNPFKLRAHDLRHTYCTLLYSAGVDVKTAAYLMGHSDVTVTMKIYTHLSEDKKSESTAVLTQYLDSHLTAMQTKKNIPNETNEK